MGMRRVFCCYMGRSGRKAIRGAVAEEGARVLRALGCETKFFDPTGLPLPDGAPDSHPKVQELRELALWSEGMVWSSPERHGAMTGILKNSN